jgi:hypothetical protein
MSKVPLQIRCDCENFAPSVEQLKIELGVEGVKGRIVSYEFTVRDFAGRVAYSRTTDVPGAPPLYLYWEGDRSGGPLPWCTPLDSPLTLEVIADVDDNTGAVLPVDSGLPKIPPPSWMQNCPHRHREEELVKTARNKFLPTGLRDWSKAAQMRVLYHSIELRRGPWLPNGEKPSPGSSELLALKLNELGYWAGPAGSAWSGSHLHRARRHYERNHRRPALGLELDLFSVEESLNKSGQNRLPGLMAAFPTSDPLEPMLVPIQEDDGILPDGANPIRVYVEAISYTGDFRKNFNELRDQYQPGKSKLEVEQAKLNRPNIPLEAVIFLKSKTGDSLLAPYAVGDVRVEWIAHEQAHDVSDLPLDSSVDCYARKYVGGCLAKFQSGEYHNCPESLGGARGSDNPWLNSFWTFPEDSYKPYVTRTDFKREVVYVHACTDAKYARCVGKAGLFLCPSFVAGDQYQVECRLSFIDRPNKAALDIDNGLLNYVSAPIQVWRYTRMAVVIGWPCREISGAVWSRVRAEFAACRIDLDLSDMEQVDITAVLSKEDYATWTTWCANVNKMNAEDYRRIFDLGDLRPSGLIGVTKAFGKGDNDDMLLSTFISAVLFSDLPPRDGSKPEGGLNRICDLLSRGIRRRRPHGLAVVDYDPEGRLRGVVGFPVDAPANGMEDGLVLVNQAMKVRQDFIYAHELAHCLWLRHHENAESDEDLLADHDQSDHDCMMSYPRDQPKYKHQTWKGYDPHFCGKCNLKLRGWNVRSPKLPDRS